MKTTEFTIYGNHENKKGNPIPYYRQTQASARFNKGAIRYHLWKDYVRESAGIIPAHMKVTSQKAHMSIVIYFANKKHADPDNIFKGIADAIFSNDKYLSGDFDFFYDKDNPRVECDIFEKSLQNT